MSAFQCSMSAQAGPIRWLAPSARVLLLLWAGFWAWFVIADGANDGAQAVPRIVLFLVPLALIVIEAWHSALVVGSMLAGAGVFALIFFAGVPARTMLALPALVLGALFFTLAWLRKRAY